MEQRVIKIFPYSYSSLTSFETCPKKHYGEKLSKEFARPYVKQADDGDRWHKEAEQYALKGEEIPDTNPHKAVMSSIINELKSKGGEFYSEIELAVKQDLAPCGWWDKEGYTRAKLDILHIAGDEATSIDWKTGKPDPFSTQLKHSALLIFLYFPQVNIVNTRYEWLREGYPTKGKVHREFFDVDWAKFEKRVSDYKKAFETNEWPAKKSGLCKNYCGVITCVHNGKFKSA